MCVIMLAYNGLALITEKLQKQRLEEFPPIIGGSHVSVTTSLAEATNQQQAHLSLKGKHVWTLSLETERLHPHERGIQDIRKTSSQPMERCQLSYLTLCRHENLQHSCESCDNASGVPAAPPKKKRCRFLSGPPECLTTVSTPVKEYSGKVWKPVAVIPPESSHSIVTTLACEANNWLPHKTTGFKLLPAISSHRGLECGCYANSVQRSSSGCYPNSIQTSSSGCYPNSNQTSSTGCFTDSANTSSMSPVPRPASAASDTSFSSIWQDCSPKESRVRILENRSLSCEDQISGSSSINHTSPAVQNKNINCNNSSLPRCHSQPCILHHRRCGKKRRRDFHRPTLNFHKMTETAYIHNTHVPMQDDSWDIPTSKQICGSIYQVFTHGCADAIFDKTPNDSPSVESGFPEASKHMDTDLSSPAFMALPVTPLMFASPNLIRHLNTRDHEEDNQQYESQMDDEDTCVHRRDCSCLNRGTHAGTEMFPMTDLDIVEIESH